MLEQLLRVLKPSMVGENNFRGEQMHPDAPLRVYGGQVLAQAVSVAAATVDEDRIIHSQHAYFLRPGNPKLPIEYKVEPARDGFSFSSRRVVALQKGRPILVSSMSFQQPSRGDDFQSGMPEVPAPEALASERQLAIEAGKLEQSFMITTGEDLDIRVVEPVQWENLKPREPVLQAWMKTNGTVPDDLDLHRALLAYFSDSYLIDSCLIAHGRAYWDEGMQVASLDHALWFHEDFRADDWLLCTFEAERLGGGRGLARGRFFTRDGRQVATCMQEGLMRFR